MTIKDVAAETGFSAHTLRYYEKEGVIQDVKRDSSGHRFYAESDVNVLKFLNCLKLADMKIKDIKEFTRLLYEGNSTIPVRLELLKRQKTVVEAKLKETQEALEHLDWKINYYEKELEKNG